MKQFKETSFTYKNIILGIAFFIYIAFNLYLLIVHEMWRDEMNVWLMGRDLSVFELFRELRFQGHPCLWYLLVMPFAKLGFPCWIMGWISFIVMAIAAAIFLWQAPLANYSKIALIFSPLFTYYYSVIARGYCLVALFIVLLAWRYAKRFEAPVVYGLLLGLLVQADTIAVPIAGLISMIWGLEAILKDIKLKKWSACPTALQGLWIPFVSVILYLLTMAKVSDSTVFEIKDYGLYDTIQACRGFAYHIVERLTGLGQMGTIVFALLMCVIAIILIALKRNLFPPIVFAGTFAFQVIFSVFVYELNIWHFLSLGFVFIWYLWVYEIDTLNQNKCGLVIGQGINVLLVFLTISMVYRWTMDITSGFGNAINGSYSDAKYAAAFMKENIDSDEIIIETDIAYAAPIWGYAPNYRPYFVGNGKQVSYADWSVEQSGEKTYDELIDWFKNQFPDKKSFVLVSTNDSHLMEFNETMENVNLLYRTNEPSARQEDYSIYKVDLN